MSTPPLKHDGQQASTEAQSALEPEIESFEQRLKASIQTGLEQVERGECAPFDEAYKAKIRAIATRRPMQR